MDTGDWSIYERGEGGCYADHRGGEPSRDGSLEFVDFDGRGLILNFALDGERLPQGAEKATFILGEASHEVPIELQDIILSASLDTPEAVAAFAVADSLEMVIDDRSWLRLKLPGLSGVVEGLKLCAAARSDQVAGPDAPRPQPKPAVPAGAAPPAVEEQLVGKPVTKSVYVECTGKGQVCNKGASVEVPAGARKIAVLIEAPAGHCSDLRYFLSDGEGRRLATTAWLSPGANDFATIDLPRPTGLVIEAEGRRGGCNEGQLGSWAANVAIGVLEGAGAAAPAPDLPEGWAIIRDALACWIYQQSPEGIFVLQRNPGSEMPYILLGHDGWDSWIADGNLYAISFRFGEDYLPLDAQGISVADVDPAAMTRRLFLLLPEITSVVDRLKAAEAVTVTMEGGPIGTFPVSNFAAAYRATESCK